MQISSTTCYAAMFLTRCRHILQHVMRQCSWQDTDIFYHLLCGNVLDKMQTYSTTCYAAMFLTRCKHILPLVMRQCSWQDADIFYNMLCGNVPDKMQTYSTTCYAAMFLKKCRMRINRDSLLALLKLGCLTRRTQLVLYTSLCEQLPT